MTQEFLAMLAVLSPPALIFIFNSLLDEYGVFREKDRKKDIRKAFVIAYLILLPFIFFGSNILSVFGVDIPSFEIAGGILLGIISIDFLLGSHPRASYDPEKEKDGMNIVVSPMAIPLITGPGAITTTILFTSSKTMSYKLSFALLSLATYVLVYLIVVNGDLLLEKAGKSILLLFHRLIGLFLLSIAVKFVISGILTFI